jgi:hypothetical protein
MCVHTMCGRARACVLSMHCASTAWSKPRAGAGTSVATATACDLRPATASSCQLNVVSSVRSHLQHRWLMHCPVQCPAGSVRGHTVHHYCASTPRPIHRFAGQSAVCTVRVASLCARCSVVRCRQIDRLRANDCAPRRCSVCATIAACLCVCRVLSQIGCPQKIVRHGLMICIVYVLLWAVYLGGGIAY